MEKMLQVVEDPDAIKIMDESNCARILFLLREGELSAKQMHQHFNAGYEKKKTLTSIYRYLSQLEKNGFVRVSREELKKKHMIMKYYVRTAKFFISSGKHVDEMMKDVVDAASSIFATMYGLNKKNVKEKLLECMKIDSEFERAFFELHGTILLEEEKKYGWEDTMQALKLILPLIAEKEKNLITKTLSLLEKS